jgi:hypothetical protein
MPGAGLSRAGGDVPEEAKSLDSLYADARHEGGKLVIYAGGDTADQQDEDSTGPGRLAGYRGDTSTTSARQQGGQPHPTAREPTRNDLIPNRAETSLPDSPR